MGTFSISLQETMMNNSIHKLILDPLYWGPNIAVISSAIDFSMLFFFRPPVPMHNALFCIAFCLSLD